jgi:hypothetical protein
MASEFISAAGGTSNPILPGGIYKGVVRSIKGTSDRGVVAGSARIHIPYFRENFDYCPSSDQSPMDRLTIGDVVFCSFLNNKLKNLAILGRADRQTDVFIPLADTDGLGGVRPSFNGPLRGDDGSDLVGGDFHPTYSFTDGNGTGMHRSDTANSADTLHLSVSGTEAIRIGQDSYSAYGTVWFMDSYLQTQGIYPWNDGNFDCGYSTLRWRNVYASSDYYGPNQYINTSDENLKTDILDSALGLDFVLNLRPVSYKWIDKGDGDPGVRTHHGFVAQEVETLLGADAAITAMWINQEIAAEDEQPAMMHLNGVDEVRPAIPATEARTEQGLRYGELIAPMVKAIQELSAKLEAAEARIAVLEG